MKYLIVLDQLVKSDGTVVAERGESVGAIQQVCSMVGTGYNPPKPDIAGEEIWCIATASPPGCFCIPKHLGAVLTLEEEPDGITDDRVNELWLVVDYDNAKHGRMVRLLPVDGADEMGRDVPVDSLVGADEEPEAALYDRVFGSPEEGKWERVK